MLVAYSQLKNVVLFPHKREHCVLVVEDDASQLDEMLDAIRHFGLEAVGAGSVQSALLSVRRRRLTLLLLILDVHLGQGDGIRALSDFRAIGYSGPIILTSGDRDALHRDVASSIRPHSLLEKPIAPEMLKATLCSVLAA